MVLVSSPALLKNRSMDQFFKELGHTVLARWKEQNFSLAHFPEIAKSVLDEQPPSENVDLAALIRHFLLDDEQPFQTNSNFGQPELVVYDDPRFYIQILFWLDGTTAIHQHEFSGAFHVLQGSSIHSEFAFENPQPITAHFRVGDLKMKSTELLETGSTVPIISGSGHIHSLFHLETPSLTVVVRTHSDPGTGPQFTYLPPHIAVDPFFSDTLTARRKELLDVLERIEDPSYSELVIEMLQSLDFERGFFILQHAMGYLRTLDQWEDAYAVFQQKHGTLAKYVAATIEEIDWRDGPLGFRSSSTDVEHRFLLALLLNVPTRKDVLALVEKRFPDASVDTVMRWAEELSEMSHLGTWILDAEFPLEVEVPKTKQPEVYFAALRHFLEGKQAAKGVKLGQVSLSAQDIEHLRASFARSTLRSLVS